MIKLTQTLLLLFVISSFSQNKIQLKGKIYSKNKPLNEVNIYNITSAKGTITNTDGLFSLQVELGDKLVITAMPYKEKRVVITAKIVSFAYLEINLLEDINTLDEVVVDSRKLVGSLYIDVNNVPEDANSVYKAKFTVDVSTIDFDEITMYDDNDISTRGLEEVSTQYNYGNLLGIVSLLINGAKKKKKYRPKKVLIIKNVPMYFREEIGDNFFLKELSIPKVHIDDFLEEYCVLDEFIELYKANRKIECIAYLIEKNKIRKYCLPSK